MEIEIPKHIKKRKSSTSKSSRRSNHKHIYNDCILKREDSKFYNKSTYCTICGKLGDTEYIGTEIDDETGRYIHKVLSQEEIKEMYKGLPIFNVKDYTDRFIKIENMEGGNLK